MKWPEKRGPDICRCILAGQLVITMLLTRRGERRDPNKLKEMMNLILVSIID